MVCLLIDKLIKVPHKPMSKINAIFKDSLSGKKKLRANEINFINRMPGAFSETKQFRYLVNKTNCYLFCG